MACALAERVCVLRVLARVLAWTRGERFRFGVRWRCAAAAHHTCTQVRARAGNMWSQAGCDAAMFVRVWRLVL